MAKRVQESHITKTLATIGQRIKELRQEQGYTNYESFAFDHDLPRSQIGRYESGYDLQVSSLLKVLKALDTDIVDFFNEDFKKIKTSNKKKSS